MRPCRLCNSRLDSLLNLGDLAISTFPLPGDPPPPKAPLNLAVCSDCRAVQLADTVDPEQLFREYWYQSSINEAMIAELHDVVRQALTRVTLKTPHDLVMDVGANDGTLLAHYREYAPSRYIIRVGIEPAHNLQASLIPNCEVAIPEFFPPQPFDLIRGMVGRVKILTSVACFYDLDDPHLFIETAKLLLHDDGVWVVQFQDLAQMLAATAFDNICHEHLLYYTLRGIEQLIQPYGLRVTYAERRVINGGSLRLTIQHGHHLEDTYGSVRELRIREQHCDDWDKLEHFAWRVGQARESIQALMSRVQVLDLYGASTKGNTLLQYCGFGPQQIRQAWERTPAKWGRTTVTGIPIVSEAVGRMDPPDALLSGIWQWRDSTIQREWAFLALGRPIIFPLPVVEVVQGAVVTT